MKFGTLTIRTFLLIGAYVFGIYSCTLGEVGEEEVNKSNLLRFKAYVINKDTLAKEAFKELDYIGQVSYVKKSDSTYIIQADDFAQELCLWDDRGMSIWDSTCENWELLLSFKAGDNLLYTLTQKVEGFYLPRDARQEIVKDFKIGSSFYTVGKYYCDNNLSSHSITIVYFLREFGSICYISPYTSTYHFVDTFSNQNRFSLNEIKELLDAIKKDSSFFEYPRPIPPPPIMAE